MKLFDFIVYSCDLFSFLWLCFTVKIGQEEGENVMCLTVNDYAACNEVCGSCGGVCVCLCVCVCVESEFS